MVKKSKKIGIIIDRTIVFDGDKDIMDSKVEYIIQKIVSVIVEKADPVRIILFGSRAKGNANKGSDIDIALEDEKALTFREMRKMKELIDDVSGLYSVDIIVLSKVDDTFKDSIKESGVVIYEKK
ncbi:MAG TPA: nucleotidyltransferase domain-containing protein [Spirochaetota bacterium]|nr:nucleotidyltransferase domain-containing protein [Spirochaetota bacterium]